MPDPGFMMFGLPLGILAKSNRSVQRTTKPVCGLAFPAITAAQLTVDLLKLRKQVAARIGRHKWHPIEETK